MDDPNKRGLRYRYYVLRALLDGAPDKAGKPSRIPATAIEDLVMAALRKEREKGEAEAGGRITRAGMNPTPVKTSTHASSGDGSPHPTDSVTADQELVDILLEHVEVFENRIVITLIEEGVPDGTEGDDLDSIVERRT